MKIYTRIVYGWQPDGTAKVEEADSFEYEGPVALCKDAGTAAPAPDYVGGARESAADSRVNQYTPFGNLLWTQAQPATPATYAKKPQLISGGMYDWGGQWMEPVYSEGVQGSPAKPATPASARIELNPESQRALSAQQTTSADLSELAQQQTSQLENRAPFDLNSVQDISDKAYAAQTRRLDPQWTQRASEEETKLRNQGLVPGGEAYNNAMGVFNNARNDAYDTARLSSFGMMPTTFQLANSAYNQPLNYLNALRSGAQIQNPQFMSTPGANILGAQQAQGQYQMGEYAGDVSNAQAQNALTASIMSSVLRGIMGGA